MTPHKAQEYLGKNCRVNYSIKVNSFKQVTDKYGFKDWVPFIRKMPHSRSGIVTNVTVRKMIMLAFNGEDEDFEYYINLKTITSVYELHPK